MITKEVKQQIVKAINKQLSHEMSANKLAVKTGVNPSQLSRIKNGEIENVLSDGGWVTLARYLDVSLNNNQDLKIAVTPMFQKITQQLSGCQSQSLCGLLCDMSDIGKTFAAKHYALTHKNVAYIDCSQVKTKQLLIRAIAKAFGLGHTGRYNDVFQDLVFYLRALPQPLIILDEAGDLNYSAFVEIKALWNATEYLVGMYMMGADSLRFKFETNIDRHKVGYAEIFSRLGARYQKFTPDGGDEKIQFIKEHVAQIGKANGVTAAQKLYVNTGGSLRRIRIEIHKMKATLNQ